ncbi:hydroxyproline O-galactosyltransferase GALT6-like [Malania oleifera]|uniref:hydroxyproline O-galactosyltransferase GALT6-like n=1 Tax=Malania oleifera TaxID=397392 RepID=UPI0025ADA36F|nr:hydroxyproline O-galactosyltransferase GALT6-like [Malania oleifera]
MKRGKLEVVVYLGRQRSIQILACAGFLYLLLVTLEAPFLFKKGLRDGTDEGFNGGFLSDGLSQHFQLESAENLERKEAPVRPLTRVSHGLLQSRPEHNPERRVVAENTMVSGLVFEEETFNSSSKDGSSRLRKAAEIAWKQGKKLWDELKSGKIKIDAVKSSENRTENCPHSVFLSGSEFLERGRVMMIPCGMTLGSTIAIVGKPRPAHLEKNPKISLYKAGDNLATISQFMMELQGLKTVEGEDPPRILHFNPRLKGDWTRMPVIEMNTCYRMQWGSAVRCDGFKSKAEEELVDGQVKCEKWIRGDDNHTEESTATWWLERLIGRKKEVTFNWPFPFQEDKHFVLTLSAGLEGYHVNVDGRHVASFPYRTGFTLEDATGLYVNGDIDVHSVFAAALPTSHPSFAPQKHLEMSNRWKAPPVRNGPVELFVGILSAGHHFAERMAVRKSWMQHELLKSSNVVARFFVAIHARKEINVELKKEAEYFGDIVIVPYMDNYDLVVLKTVAICEYGVRKVSAKYIMKCDDDTFVNLDAIIRETKYVPDNTTVYFGNINYYHKPLRDGKWAVTHEEWPEEDYPPYANGAGYLLSSDIAGFIVSEFEKHKLRIFKMEDVSVGMWVGQFYTFKMVEYLHSARFCQFGCIENYYTAHYQSPRQMICLWNKLQEGGNPVCCNG